MKLYMKLIDEQVKETLIANEYYFNEQGKIEEA